MIWIVIVLAVVALIFYAAIKYQHQNNQQNNEYNYRKLDTLFSPAERSFLGILNQVVADNAYVFGKVRVADVIAPEKNASRKKRQILFNKISSKHFDYILCDKNDLSILCAIELNDKSHNSKKRKDRDKFLTAACESANFPLIQVPAQAAYNIDEIRESLINHMSSIPNNI
jgi:hypothetical protein